MMGWAHTLTATRCKSCGAEAELHPTSRVWMYTNSNVSTLLSQTDRGMRWTHISSASNRLSLDKWLNNIWINMLPHVEVQKVQVLHPSSVINERNMIHSVLSLGQKAPVFRVRSASAEPWVNDVFDGFHHCERGLFMKLGSLYIRKMGTCLKLVLHGPEKTWLWWSVCSKGRKRTTTRMHFITARLLQPGHRLCHNTAKQQTDSSFMR